MERRCPGRHFSFGFSTSNGDCVMKTSSRPRPLSCDDSSSLETAEGDDVKLFHFLWRNKRRRNAPSGRLVALTLSYFKIQSTFLCHPTVLTDAVWTRILRKFTKARLGVNCLQLNAYSLCHFILFSDTKRKFPITTFIIMLRNLKNLVHYKNVRKSDETKDLSLADEMCEDSSHERTFRCLS